MPNSRHGQLVPNVVTRVTVEQGWSGIEVINRDQRGVIWVRLDGKDPEPNGDDSFLCMGTRSFPLRRKIAGNAPITVTLLSDEALWFSVETM